MVSTAGSNELLFARHIEMQSPGETCRDTLSRQVPARNAAWIYDAMALNWEASVNVQRRLSVGYICDICA